MAQEQDSGPIRLAVVGCGWISDWHGRAAAQIPELRVVACCDVNADAAERWRERYGCERAYTDYRTMLQEEELDAVLLATWPPHHTEQIMACLEAGVRNVLCEKSLTVGSDEVVEIWESVRAANALLVEGFMYRHHPAMRKVDELLAAGALGQIDNITAGFDFFDPEEAGPDEPRDWRQRAELHGGVPYDLLCYAVNACNHAAGAVPVQAFAFSRRSERYDTIHRVYGVIEYENGVVGLVHSSKKSDHDYELKINGSTGQLVLPVTITPDRLPPRTDFEEGEFTTLRLARTTDLFAYETTEIEIPAADPYRCQLEDFVAAVHGKATPEPVLAESVMNVMTINALLTSAEQGMPAGIALPDAVRAELGAAVPTS